MDNPLSSGGSLQMRVSNVALRTKKALDNGKRIIVNQGGTRSSKTTSLCQLFITLAHSEPCILSIVRETMPSLRGSAMRDFQELLEKYELYEPKNHDKTNSIYRLGQSEVEFFGVDENQKVRGRKRKYLWCNEANELAYEDFQQLILRTTGVVFLDYNPSDTDHWIYDKVLTRADCELIKSSYKDNPFLDAITVQEIKRLESEDENAWRIYGLGERGIRRTAVYSRYDYAEWPESVTESMWGLDFGYNPDPSCLVRVGFKGQELHVDEWLYERNLTNTELIAKMQALGVSKTEELIADSAEPARIEEIRRAGFNVHPCIKGEGAVRAGIDICRRFVVHFTPRSANVKRDWAGYSSKVDKNGNIIAGEYVKFNVHGCDATRYPVQKAVSATKAEVLFTA